MCGIVNIFKISKLNDSCFGSFGVDTIIRNISVKLSPSRRIWEFAYRRWKPAVMTGGNNYKSYLTTATLCSFKRRYIRKDGAVLSSYTKVEAGYKPSQTTETLIGYTACWRLGYFVGTSNDEPKLTSNPLLNKTSCSASKITSELLLIRTSPCGFDVVTLFPT